MSKTEHIEAMKGIFRWLELEKEDICDDFALAKSKVSEPKILDIGCDVGITTIAIASVLDSPMVVGIDKRPDAITIARRWREEAIRYIQQSEGNRNAEYKATILFGVRRFPEFIVGDIICNENLTIEADLVYCRKVLVPIHEKEYDNRFSGDEGVHIAIGNIARAVRIEGWAIVIEKNLKSYGINKDFASFLEQAGLELIKIEPLTRFDILSTGKRSAPYDYVRYICKKS